MRQTARPLRSADFWPILQNRGRGGVLKRSACLSCSHEQENSRVYAHKSTICRKHIRAQKKKCVIFTQRGFSVTHGWTKQSSDTPLTNKIICRDSVHETKIFRHDLNRQKNFLLHHSLTKQLSVTQFTDKIIFRDNIHEQKIISLKILLIFLQFSVPFAKTHASILKIYWEEPANVKLNLRHYAHAMRFYFVFERRLLRISAGTPPILTRVYRGFPWFLQMNGGWYLK
jgi:hypothetical protein